MMKLVFAGTPEFATVALQALHRAGFEIALVLTQPDRPSGRGLQLQASAVKQYARTHEIPVAQPTSLRLDGRWPDQARLAHDLLRATPHDAMVVAAYGLILPPSVLGIPPLGCINIHASLLPRWRGAAPIHRAVEAGDAVTGVTLMQMEEGLDTGPMLMMESLPIGSGDTTGTLHDKLAALGARLVVEALPKLQLGLLPKIRQPLEGASYAAKIVKDEAVLDLTRPAGVLARKIHAFNPFPGAVASLEGALVKIWEAEAMEDVVTAMPPGTVLAANAREGILIACGSGVLRLTGLQKPGGKKLAAAEFIKACPLEGRRFG